MSTNEKPSKETLEQWSKDPNNWVWGIFYYNKEDQRIFPPKRIESMGFTLNFANPKSILATLAFMGFFAFVAFFILRKK